MQLAAMRASMAQAIQNAAVKPSAKSKADLFARLEITDDPVGRDFPPYIHSKVELADFMPWIAEAMTTISQSQADFDCIHVASSTDTHTFLARMCSSIPSEVHAVEVERVLLVDGCCDFVIADEVHHFGPGDRYQIPLHKPHHAYVTSDKPCIFIVQRTMA